MYNRFKYPDVTVIKVRRLEGFKMDGERRVQK